MSADELVGSWLVDLAGRVPALELFDAHTHIGQNDPDGYSATAEQLTAGLEAAGARGVAFPMHEPDGYSAANERVIEAAAASGGRLTAFCRLDPAAEPLAEARRCLDAGAAGIKLHPRAERFSLDTPELSEVFLLAEERRLCVLVHAGRGIPALGRHAVNVCERHPGLRLILAHAGICDLAWIWRASADHGNLFFDTAWWSPSDMLALFALVPPRQLLFASDAPYSRTSLAAVMSLRYAMQAGLTAEQMRLVFGGQLERLLRGDDPADSGPAPGPARLDRDPLLDRVHSFLIGAIGQMFAGEQPAEMLALAALACEVGAGAPQAAICATVLRLLELREEVARGEADGSRPRAVGVPERFGSGLPLIVLAACVARTPAAPIPPHDERATGVEERQAQRPLRRRA